MGSKAIKFVSDLEYMSKQWDFERNFISPNEVHSGSAKKYYWVCDQGHSFLDTASHRKSGRGCPVCSGRILVRGINDLSTLYPEVSTEWNILMNEANPDDFLSGSNKKVWWRCSRGHEWQATIVSRTKNNSGCPFCSGREAIEGENDLVSQYPIIAEEWHYKKNAKLKPNEIKAKSNRKVWWICYKGHEWQATPANRILSRTNCPTCSSELRTSFPEQTILFYVSKIYKDATSRYILDNKQTEIDIYIPSLKIGIEYNGVYFHKNSDKDERKLKYINEMGIQLFRVIETSLELDNDSDIPIRYPVKFANLDKSIYELLNRISRYSNLKPESISIDSESDRIEIYSNYLQLEKSNSLFITHPEISKRWNYDKNFSLEPNQVSGGSHKKVWWTCKRGHSYEDTINHQVNGRGCPVCSNRKVIAGVNDLLTLNPELSKEWNYLRNKVDISKISIGSPKKVWWICKRGHEWEATVNARSSGGSCPYCSGRYAIEGETDLLSCYPNLSKSIHPTKNVDVDLKKLKPGTHQKIWWLCDKGHEWEASVNNRVKGRGCPICSNRKIVAGINDLQTLKPDLAKEWNYKKNNIYPYEVSIKSNKKVWWICAKGHEWETTISHRSNGTACPICFSNNRSIK
jgi:glutaredoxin